MRLVPCKICWKWTKRLPTVRYYYAQANTPLGEIDVLPLLPLKLIFGNKSVAVSGLIDTGATVNVLPYSVGIELGANWQEQTVPLRLTGNLAHFEARVLIINAQVRQFPIVRLAFAWTQTDDAPLLLGQVNFFAEFDICFYRSHSEFEINPKR